MRPSCCHYKMNASQTLRLDRRYLGRFAPSPTGDLHFGSLVAAAGSFLQARSSGGGWIVRIEDLDPPREVAGAAQRQVATLASFGLVSDAPVAHQSARRSVHEQIIAGLVRSVQAFPCACSRRDLPENGVYPGTCRQGVPAGRSGRSIRFAVDPEQVQFMDAVQGLITQVPAHQCGDFIIRRADGLVAYQLAVVVDDAAAGVTEVVRGADLIDSTGRQILLQRALGLPEPRYVHLPLIVDRQGRKLSKSDGADPVQRYRPQTALRLALRALGHEPPAAAQGLDALWRWALRNWNLGQVPSGPITIDVQGRTGRDYTAEDQQPPST